jgi:hypothetical protein
MSPRARRRVAPVRRAAHMSTSMVGCIVLVPTARPARTVVERRVYSVAPAVRMWQWVGSAHQCNLRLGDGSSESQVKSHNWGVRRVGLGSRPVHLWRPWPACARAHWLALLVGRRRAAAGHACSSLRCRRFGSRACRVRPSGMTRSRQRGRLHTPPLRPSRPTTTWRLRVQFRRRCAAPSFATARAILSAVARCAWRAEPMRPHAR